MVSECSYDKRYTYPKKDDVKGEEKPFYSYSFNKGKKR